MTWLYIPKHCMPSRSVRESADSMPVYNLRPRKLRPFVMWRGKRMQRRRLFAVWRRELWMKLLYGLTCEPSTAARGVTRWISSLGDTLVSRSPWLERCKAKKTQGTSGPTLPAWSPNAARSFVSSRTSPDIYRWDFARSMMTFKNWVLQLRRACSRRRRSVRRTVGNDSLFSQWKTPTNSDYKGSSRPDQRAGQLSCQAEQNWPTATVGDSFNARNKTSGRQPGSKHHDGVTLSDAVNLWPTPDAAIVTDTEDPDNWIARMNERRVQNRVKYGTPLTVASRIWPRWVVQGKTRSLNGLDFFLQFLPTTQNGRSYFVTPRNLRRLSRRAEKNLALRLNPNFAEWLMGWPIGWTDFGPLATESVPYRRRMHSLFCRLASAYSLAVKADTKSQIVPRRRF